MIKIQSLEINNDKKEQVVFNYARDNKGKGIDAKILIKILKKLGTMGEKIEILGPIVKWHYASFAMTSREFDSP